MIKIVGATLLDTPMHMGSAVGWVASESMLPGVLGKTLELGWVEWAPWNSAVQVVSLAPIIWLQMYAYVL